MSGISLYPALANSNSRTLVLPESSISTLARPSLTAPQILCASQTPFTISIDEDKQPLVNAFDSFKNTIHTIFRSTIDESHPSEQFLAADNDRYINVYDVTEKRLTKTLIAGSEVESADFYTPPAGTKRVLAEQLLAVITKEGLVELFQRPFTHQKSVNGDLKSKRKNLTSKASAKVKLISANSTKSIPIFSASFQGPDLVFATAEGGVDVTFQKIRWQDEGNGELLFDGIKEVKHSKTASTLNTATMNGAKDMGKSHVDESKTVVVNGEAHGGSQNAAIEIESSDDEKDLSEAEAESDDEKPLGRLKTVEVQGEMDESNAEPDESMDEVAEVPQGSRDEEMAEGEPEEPSFGELLAHKHSGVISVADALHPESSTLVQVGDNKTISIPSGVSLSTVLTQSLRTNDHNLLESCLHSADTDIIKNTIQRLDSSLAGVLLQKLAERLASRPGRYGHLLIWVQWTCIVHGGAIAGRPEVFSKIETLYGVLSQRTKSLDSLLLLKGKLDMLDAQLALRRDIQSHRGARHGHEEANVIYVDEGDNWSSDQDEGMEALPAPSRSKKPRKALKQLVDNSESEETSGDDEEMPAITNGVSSDMEDASEDEESESEADISIQKSKAKPANKMDAIIDDEADESHPSDEESASSDEDEDSDKEEDSEMDDFINDDSIDEEVVEDDVMIEGDESDDEPEPVVEKPKKKKAKHT
jgi:U3 small nucleolar RNA-associated protein 5